MALLFRLKHLNIIDQSHIEKYSKNIKRGAIEHGYSIDLYEPGNKNLVLGDYGALARELFDQEKISESHYYSLLIDLGMNLDAIEELKNNASE